MQLTSMILWLFVIVIAILIWTGNKIFREDSKKILFSKLILLIASYMFIAYADVRFAFVILLLTVVTWWSSQNRKRVKVGVTFSVIILGYFKYTNFFIESSAKLIGNSDAIVLNLILPLGISFYTFSAISYMVDVTRNKVEKQSLFNVALYLSFFPKLTSGPIQRSADFFEQMSKVRAISWLSFAIGIQIVCFGLFKKFVLADRLSIFVNQVYETPMAFNSATIILAVLAYSFQIYFDFSGYSDMAIGVAKILDIDLPRNFNLPYLSHNVSEFWKRWHISLSSWLQEYLYFPLGGNRKGKVRTYSNLVLTMVIGGLWHGAQWTYIFWGLLHGLALAVHKLWVSKTKSNMNEHGVLANTLSICITFIFVSFCWIFFRAESIEKAIEIIVLMMTGHEGIYHPYLWFFFVAIIYIIAAIFAKQNSERGVLRERHKNMSWVQGYYPIQDLSTVKGLIKFFVFAGLIFGLAYTGGSPFIYGAY